MGEGWAGTKARSAAVNGRCACARPPPLVPLRAHSHTPTPITPPPNTNPLITRHHRVDYSAVHAHAARQALLRNLARGEAAVDLADAALQIAAEDDALGGWRVWG